MDRHTGGLPLSDSEIEVRLFEKERRRRPRVPVRWEIRFCAGAETLISATTENLSCDGFYCASDRSVEQGGGRCVIVIPSHIPNQPAQALYLHCDVQVLRVEDGPGQHFGIAARILGFHSVGTHR